MASLVLVVGALSMIGTIGIQMADAAVIGDSGIGGDKNFGDCKKSPNPPNADDKCKRKYTGSR